MSNIWFNVNSYKHVILHLTSADHDLICNDLTLDWAQSILVHWTEGLLMNTLTSGMNSWLKWRCSIFGLENQLFSLKLPLIETLEDFSEFKAFNNIRINNCWSFDDRANFFERNDGYYGGAQLLETIIQLLSSVIHLTF